MGHLSYIWPLDGINGVPFVYWSSLWSFKIVISSFCVVVVVVVILVVVSSSSSSPLFLLARYSS